MSITAAEKKIKGLCALFNSEVRVVYARRLDQWQITFTDVYLYSENDHKTYYPDGSIDRGINSGAHPYGQGPTLLDAIIAAERATVHNDRGFVLSNKPIDIFSASDETPHTVTVYEGWHKVDGFLHDHRRTRQAVQKYAPR